MKNPLETVLIILFLLSAVSQAVAKNQVHGAGLLKDGTLWMKSSKGTSVQFHNNGDIYVDDVFTLNCSERNERREVVLSKAAVRCDQNQIKVFVLSKEGQQLFRMHENGVTIYGSGTVYKASYDKLETKKQNTSFLVQSN